MAGVVEEQVANSWLFNRMTTAPTLVAYVGSRVYLKIAPTSTTGNPVVFPLIRYIPMSHTDIKAIGSVGPKRPWTSHRYVIGGVEKVGSTAQLKDIMGIVDGLFDEVQDVYQGQQIDCWRTGVLDPAPYTIGTDQYRELQLQFRLMMQPVS